MRVRGVRARRAGVRVRVTTYYQDLVEPRDLLRLGVLVVDAVVDDAEAGRLVEHVVHLVERHLAAELQVDRLAVRAQHLGRYAEVCGGMGRYGELQVDALAVRAQHLVRGRGRGQGLGVVSKGVAAGIGVGIGVATGSVSGLG